MEAEGLGRVFNVIPTGDAAWINMRDTDSVSFICVGANAETFILQEATAVDGSSSQDLNTLAQYYKNTAAVGATTWVLDTAPTAADTVTTTTAHPVAVFTVRASELSAGFDYIRVSSSSSGTVVVLAHDLRVQRAPQNLPALVA